MGVVEDARFRAGHAIVEAPRPFGDHVALEPRLHLVGSLAGASGIPALEKLLVPKGGLLARKEDPETRACAAMATPSRLMRPSCSVVPRSYSSSCWGAPGSTTALLVNMMRSPGIQIGET